MPELSSTLVGLAGMLCRRYPETPLILSPPIDELKFKVGLHDYPVRWGGQPEGLGELFCELRWRYGLRRTGETEQATQQDKDAFHSAQNQVFVSVLPFTKALSPGMFALPAAMPASINSECCGTSISKKPVLFLRRRTLHKVRLCRLLRRLRANPESFGKCSGRVDFLDLSGFSRQES